MRVIGFVGMPASGKSEAAIIAKELGVPVVAMGDIVRDYTQDLGARIDEKNVGFIANKLREERGMDAIAKMCIPVIHRQKSDVVVIDGIRGFAEVLAYKSEFGEDFISIAIDASPELRYQRTKKRARSDDAMDYESFKTKDERELSWGLKEALDNADLRILNEGLLEEFQSLISNILIKQFNVKTPFRVIYIHIKTPLNATESKDKVERAIMNIFPDARLSQTKECIVGTSNSIKTFGELLKMQRIRSTARIELLKRLSSDAFEFVLNKQAAFMGKVNFSKDPLGPIYVKVQVDTPILVVDCIAPELSI
ncbi:MAG TPA: AAA family ATPase [Candidatus Acidoferrum sp.]|nr:AAA family ATPase [Candidatus Acidoferrum sp.]